MGGASTNQRPGFPWYALPANAVVNRWWALGGLMLTLVIMYVCYWSVNEFAAARGVTRFDPAQLFVVDGRSLDSRIPYLPWTIIIYHLFYKAFFWLAVLAYPKTESGARALFRLYSGVIVITIAACVVFIVSPAEMTLRAGAIQDSSQWHEINMMLRSTDRAFNTWPCLHVAQTGLVLLVVVRWLGRRRWTVLLWVAWTAVAISTLTIKQHFIWDIITGIPLALAYWQWKLRSCFPHPG